MSYHAFEAYVWETIYDDKGNEYKLEVFLMC